MKILNVDPTPFDETPAKTDRWYDRHNTRCWVVQTLNAAGDQLGDATYVHSKREAIADEKRRLSEIAGHPQALAKAAKTWRGDVPARWAADQLGIPLRTWEGIEQGRGFAYPDLLLIAFHHEVCRQPA